MVGSNKLRHVKDIEIVARLRRRIPLPRFSKQTALSSRYF